MNTTLSEARGLLTKAVYYNGHYEREGRIAVIKALIPLVPNPHALENMRSRELIKLATKYQWETK